jgi:hypothetical protein
MRKSEREIGTFLFVSFIQLRNKRSVYYMEVGLLEIVGLY